MGILRKLYNNIIYSRLSASRTAHFRKKIRRIILLNNRTRWNFWFQFFYTILEYISEIDKYVRDNLDSLYKNFLTIGNWNNLRTIHDFLDIFYQAIFKTQRHAARLNKVMKIIDVFLIYLKEIRVRYISLLFNWKIELIR
jgi:hypothetical protein